MERTTRASCAGCGWRGTLTSAARAAYAQRQHRCAAHQPRKRRQYKQDPRWVKQWKLERDRGIARTVAAAPVRAHIAQLRASGWSLCGIAEVAGVSTSTVLHVTEGTTRTRRTIAVAILAVTPQRLADRASAEAFVLRAGSVRRIQALLALGWRHQDISAAMAVSGVRTTSVMVLHQVGHLLARRTADAVTTAYDHLSMTPGPSARTARRAAKAGYLPPLAWDDDRIDDPEYVPTGELLEPELDEVAIERLMAGDPPAGATKAERREAVRRLTEQGLSAKRVADRLGGNTRLVTRDRAKSRAA